MSRFSCSAKKSCLPTIFDIVFHLRKVFYYSKWPEWRALMFCSLFKPWLSVWQNGKAEFRVQVEQAIATFAVIELNSFMLLVLKFKRFLGQLLILKCWKVDDLKKKLRCTFTLISTFIKAKEHFHLIFFPYATMTLSRMRKKFNEESNPLNIHEDC